MVEFLQGPSGDVQVAVFARLSAQFQTKVGVLSSQDLSHFKRPIRLVGFGTTFHWTVENQAQTSYTFVLRLLFSTDGGILVI